MKYFTKVTQDYWSSKNKLHTALKDLMRRQDCRMLFDDEHKNEFIKEMQSDVARLCDLHPRCKPIKLQVINRESLIQSDETQHTGLIIPGISHLKIYKSRNFWT